MRKDLIVDQLHIKSHIKDSSYYLPIITKPVIEKFCYEKCCQVNKLTLPITDKYALMHSHHDYILGAMSDYSLKKNI